MIEFFIFDNFVLAGAGTVQVAEWFENVLYWLAICLFVNNVLYGKLFSLLPFIFYDNLKVIYVAFLVADFNLQSHEYDNSTFTLL